MSGSAEAMIRAGRKFSMPSPSFGGSGDWEVKSLSAAASRSRWQGRYAAV